jgi:hypothetical protein
LDKDGYLRFAHTGEGAYRECEEVIQELLREIDPDVLLPEFLAPVRGEDVLGAICYPPTPELYLGHRRGRIGNAGGFKEDQVAEYEFAGQLEENCFYASGTWASTAEYFESAGEGAHHLILRYSASAVNLVMASPRGPSCEVIIRQDGRPLTHEQATTDTQFHTISGQQESLILVQQPRMHFLVDNHEFGEHMLELICPKGLAAFAFTFSSCIENGPSSIPTGVARPA